MPQSRHRRNCKVLIVDDDPAILSSLEQILSRDGFIVQTAKSGEAALASVARETPQVVLTDVQMSGLNGLELITALRLGRRNFPIVAMTGAAEQDTLGFARKLGADAAIRKPFKRAELVDLIDYCLDRTGPS